ncbi:MAG TPA: oligosaccharide flippase family protein [Lentibacillus sp.]|uniref:lipopolysaccharide biosynthesis protein n=1 Tax=Lentibacillus sp. TaxID=1925746 RepID=UPI002B4AEC74|nr:oligosaccharide flippase family protein [Lentibacillus sp.]HLR62767.1 oligosaccharide flippase family protein [Lentibacillus sp.]
MKRQVLTLLKRPFVRNVVIMASGTAAAQAISLALTPIITRLYGPEAYGLMGVFMAIIQTVAPVAALTYPIAVVLPKRDKDAKGLMRLSVYISIGIAAVAAIIIILFDKPIVELFQLGDIAPFLLLIPLVILFSAFMQTAEQWLVRTKQFGITAKAAFLQALIIQGSKAGIGFIHPAAAVLIVLTALGNGVKALLMVLLRKKSPGDTNEGAISYRELGKRYRDFPVYRAPQVLINGISHNIPVLLLSGFFGPASAGFYSIGRTVLGLPIQLIGKSVGDVFYPRITEARDEGENLTHLIGKATLALTAIGIIPFGTIVLFGPWLFSFVFGADWATAGEYARWMSLWIFFIFVNQPSIKALPVLAAQAFFLKYSIVTIVIRTGALLGGYYIFTDDVAAVASFSIAAALLSLGLILMTLHISKTFAK